MKMPENKYDIYFNKIKRQYKIGELFKNELNDFCMIICSSVLATCELKGDVHSRFYIHMTKQKRMWTSPDFECVTLDESAMNNLIAFQKAMEIEHNKGRKLEDDV